MLGFNHISECRRIFYHITGISADSTICARARFLARASWTAKSLCWKGSFSLSCLAMMACKSSFAALRPVCERA